MQIFAGTEHVLHGNRQRHRLLEPRGAEEGGGPRCIASRMMRALEVAARERRQPHQCNSPQKLPCLAMLGKRDLLDLDAEALQLARRLAHGGVHIFLRARMGESFLEDAEPQTVHILAECLAIRLDPHLLLSRPASYTLKLEKCNNLRRCKLTWTPNSVMRHHSDGVAPAYMSKAQTGSSFVTSGCAS